jgi:hypothetical protein
MVGFAVTIDATRGCWSPPRKRETTAFDDVAADVADDVAEWAVDVMVDAAATRRGFKRANFMDTMMTVEAMVKVFETEN